MTSRGVNVPEAVLRQRLRLKPGSTTVLQSRENSQLEFKQTFDWGNKARYARTMAAFANNQGGFLVFGVKNAPHELVGLKGKRFDDLDPAVVTTYLNSVLSAEIPWECGRLELHEVGLGYFHTGVVRDKPVICTKNDDCLAEGQIYYRYRGQTSAIRFPELRSLLEERMARERRALLQHVRVISDAGPTNVSVLDLLHGRGYGGTGPFLIDESLVRELTFVREGSFAAAEGQPTLRLLGDVKPISGVATGRPVPVAVHYEDLVTAFLGERDLTPADAKIYLAEAAQQFTPIVPVHVFRVRSGLTREGAAEYLMGLHVPFPGCRKRLVERVKNRQALGPLGTTSVAPWPPDKDSFVQSLKSGRALLVRSLCRLALCRRLEYLDDATADLAGSRLWEAVTHLSETEVQDLRPLLLPAVLSAFSRRFDLMLGSEKTATRRAIAHIDEALFGNA